MSDTPSTAPPSSVCSHGGLRRQCEVCRLGAELDAAETEHARLQAELEATRQERDVERAARDTESEAWGHHLRQRNEYFARAEAAEAQVTVLTAALEEARKEQIHAMYDADERDALTARVQQLEMAVRGALASDGQSTPPSEDHG